MQTMTTHVDEDSRRSEALGRPPQTGALIEQTSGE
jgi:hypothetical protein